AINVTPEVETTKGELPAGSSGVEPGTGFYEKRFTANEIKPSMANIIVKKTDSGISWGSVHWQYLEDMSKVKPYEGTPLKIKKSLFIKQSSRTGQILVPIKDTVNVGDELVVRIEIRVDRDM
ncbi:MAG: alpha-2-macroglobulin family protein, partial [Verrucomicrobiae bacterium]|nr:alpha-2-macroglobulin family protein [Verrucomicrobiae bacterium]